MEISHEFANAMDGRGWDAIAKILSVSEDLLDATLGGNADKVALGTDAAHMEHASVLSYHDENSLSCVITIAYFSAKKDYLLIKKSASLPNQMNLRHDNSLK